MTIERSSWQSSWKMQKQEPTTIDTKIWKCADSVGFCLSTITFSHFLLKLFYYPNAYIFFLLLPIIFWDTLLFPRKEAGKGVRYCRCVDTINRSHGAVEKACHWKLLPDFLRNGKPKKRTCKTSNDGRLELVSSSSSL